MNAADSHRVDMEQPSAGEDADRRGPSAEIDDGRAEFGLVVDQRREAGGVGRRDHGLDSEVTALDHQHEIARGRQIAGGDMQVHAEFVSDHALWIVHALRPIQRETGRKRMQHRAPGAGVGGGSGFEDPMNVVFGHGLAAQRGLGVEALRR